MVAGASTELNGRLLIFEHFLQLKKKYAKDSYSQYILLVKKVFYRVYRLYFSYGVLVNTYRVY